MTTVAIMQPYLFPYIGYFQLIKCSDVFVSLDDVQYKKGGYINRNRILPDGSKWISLPVKKNALSTSICDMRYVRSEEIDNSIIARIDQVYRKAPFFKSVMELIKDAFLFPSEYVANFNENTIISICKYLSIDLNIFKSSTLQLEPSPTSSENVLKISKYFHADIYVNPIGGIDLYEKDFFSINNIELKFIKSNLLRYKQFNDKFVSSLSILDVLMFNSPSEVHIMLEDYTLV